MTTLELGTLVRSSDGREGMVIACVAGDPLCPCELEYVRWNEPFFEYGELRLTDAYESAKHLEIVRKEVVE